VGGRIGWAPTNGSFQAFVTALRVLEGEDRAREWLEGVQANDPMVYPDNLTAVEGVASGEVDVAFVNHYYLFQVIEEQGEGLPVRNYYLKDGDPGALVLAAGAGILDSAENPGAAEEFLEFALSEEAQQYFADETYEYPLIEGVEINEELPPLSEIQSPKVDLSNLDDLGGTLSCCRRRGCSRVAAPPTGLTEEYGVVGYAALPSSCGCPRGSSVAAMLLPSSTCGALAGGRAGGGRGGRPRRRDLEVLGRSALLAATVTAASVAIAVPLAWLTARTDLRAGGFGRAGCAAARRALLRRGVRAG
jgi:hypothetical protein